MAKLRIQQLVKQRKMTMIQLAEKLNIDRVNLYSSISGNPTLNRLQEIADALDVNITELFEPEGVDVRGYVEINGKVCQIKNLNDLEDAVAYAKATNDSNDPENANETN